MSSAICPAPTGVGFSDPGDTQGEAGRARSILPLMVAFLRRYTRAMTKPRKERPEPRRPALDREPEPDEAATPAQERHINAEALRQRLLELNP
jgi:hypothetical protein